MEKNFVRFPADSVTLCAESVGIQPSQEVACGIVEDVSFRIRQLADVSCTKHAYVEWINWSWPVSDGKSIYAACEEAETYWRWYWQSDEMEWIGGKTITSGTKFMSNSSPVHTYNKKPLYGHCSDRVPPFHSIHASGLYSIPDPEVKLPDIAFSTSFVNTLQLPKPLSIKGRTITHI